MTLGFKRLGNCDTCAHFDKPYRDDDMGRCRRHPPKTAWWDTGRAEPEWPVTRPTDWCGEYWDASLVEPVP